MDWAREMRGHQLHRERGHAAVAQVRDQLERLVDGQEGDGRGARGQPADDGRVERVHRHDDVGAGHGSSTPRRRRDVLLVGVQRPPPAPGSTATT